MPAEAATPEIGFVLHRRQIGHNFRNTFPIKVLAVVVVRRELALFRTIGPAGGSPGTMGGSWPLLVCAGELGLLGSAWSHGSSAGLTDARLFLSMPGNWLCFAEVLWGSNSS